MARELLRWLAGTDDPKIDRRAAIRNLVATTSGGVLLGGCGGLSIGGNAPETNTNLDIPQRNFSPEFTKWLYEKEGKDTVLLWGQVRMPDSRLLFATSSDNRVTIFSSKPGSQIGVMFDGEVCQLFDEGWAAQFLAEAKKRLGLVASKDMCSRLFPTFRGTLVSKLSEEGAKNPNLSVVKDGDVVLEGSSPALFKGGRRYQITPAASTHFGVTREAAKLPDQFVSQIPESENKITFQDGEILVTPNNDAWYIQNGGRYKVGGNVENFCQTRHKNFRVYQVPFWVVDRVKKNELPPETFKDQYGREIDARSGRLIALMSGLTSDSDSVERDFGSIIKSLKAAGWKENQIVLLTHKFINSPARYTSHDSRSPVESRKACAQTLGWLKSRCPLSQVISVGHSMGGDAVFHGSLAHRDFVCRVVTINSPLLGIDKNVVQNLEIENWSFLRDCDDWPNTDKCLSTQFYASAGDSLTYGANMENWGMQLRNSGVELFTFSASGDPFVPTANAVLANSNTSIGSYDVRLRWELNTNFTRGSDFNPHGFLLEYEPFVSELLRVVGRP